MDPAVVEAWLAEDEAAKDLTSRAVIPDGAEGQAEIHAKQEMLVAGLEPALEILAGEDVGTDRLVEDGDRVEAGTVLARAEGPAHALLARERVAMNLLAHLSGIATRTAEVVERVEQAGASCQVLATRKTTPGLRRLEHEAVEQAGGLPHREDLAGSILVKENHLSFVTIEEAVEAARSNAPEAFVMVEAETRDEALAVARASADGVLVDNHDPQGIGDLVELLKRLEPSLTVEASGGITLDNVASYAAHVDRVSLGSITHSAPAADVSMRVEPV